MQCCQLSWIIGETPDFGPLASGLQTREWNLPDNHHKVCHFFSKLDFLTIKFQLFCVVWVILILTLNISSSTPVFHCYVIIWLVFGHFVSSQIGWQSESMSIFCTYDVIYHPFPINSRYLKTQGVDSPAYRRQSLKRIEPKGVPS